MSGLFGGKAQSGTTERYVGIQVSSSVLGSALSLLYGRRRIPFSLLWYGSFQSTPQKSGGGKGGGGSGVSSYDYTTAFLAGLCQGPITAVGQVYHDKALTTLANENLAVSLGGSAPTIWSYLSTNFPTQAIPYDHIAYVATSAYDLGSSAGMPNLTFETDGFLGFSIAHGMFDADPAHIIPDYLTDTVHGAGFKGSIATLTGSTNTYQAYCMSMGLLVSPLEDTQRDAGTFLKEMLQVTNSDAVLSVGTLKIIPYADKAVSGSTPDGSSWSYTPNLTPIYSFTDSDYMPKSGDDPVRLRRTALSDTFNDVNIEIVDRSNQYNTAPVNASDLVDIIANGRRTMTTVSLHSITQVAVGRIVAQLMLNSSLYDRNSYDFETRSDYCLLEPMDIVALTEAKLGLANQDVRILKVTDSQYDEMSFSAQELPGTVRNTPQYNWSSAAGYAANYAADPGSVVAPAIFQMPSVPASLSEGITLGVAVCGSSGNAFWSGCNVYMSADGGTTYDYIGQVTSPAIYGTTGSGISAVPDADASSTLPVVLSNTNLQLDTSATHSDADNGLTLILVGSGTTAEIMTYGTAALTSAGHYNLTYLRRNLYGSANQSHSSGVQFVRLDGRVFQIAVDPGTAGQTLYFKFCSFNTWGRATQDISVATAYSYTVPSALPVSGTAQLIPRGSCAVSDGTIYKATTGASAWDSDAITANAYPSIIISGRYGVGGALAIGLAAAPGSVAVPQTSTFDYAIYPHLDSGNLVVTVGSTAVYTGSPPVSGDAYEVDYDGYTVRFRIKGVQVYQYQGPGLTLYGVVAEYSPGAVMSNIEVVTGSIATPTMWQTSGNCGITDTNAYKLAGAGTAWDCAAVTYVGYPNCHITAKINAFSSPANNTMFGFITNPSALLASISSNYVLFNFAWHDSVGVGQWQIYELGTAIVSLSAPLLTDVPWITYDGSDVRYYLNDPTTPVHTTHFPGLTLFGAVALFDANAPGLNSLRFGPTTNLAVMDTGQLATNAATLVSRTTVASTTLTNGSITAIGSQSVGPFSAPTTALVVTATGSYEFDTGANADGLLLSVGPNSGSHGGPFFKNIRSDPLTTSQPASQTTRGAFAVEYTFDLLNGQTDSFSISAIPSISQPGTSTIKILDLVSKIEVLKR